MDVSGCDVTSTMSILISLNCYIYKRAIWIMIAFFARLREWSLIRGGGGLVKLLAMLNGGHKRF